jgi:phosphoenolpyruvate synthase/pyruvate phosphate dikinase
MARNNSNETIYNLHHIFQPIILEVVEKVLKLNCFTESKKRLEWDFINDIGVINLLRRNYFQTGNLKVIFDQYQSSRLDVVSPRYESLFATTIVTIIGSVISGIIVLHYEDLKTKISEWIKNKNKTYKFNGEEIDEIKLLKIIIQKQNSIRNFSKFCSEKSEELKNDLEILKKCYIANLMLNNNQINYSKYYELTKSFLNMKNNEDEDFQQFEYEYSKSEKAIDIEKVFLAIDGYSRGVLGIRINDSEYTTSSIKPGPNELFYQGLAASRGFGSGVSYTYKSGENVTNSKYILLIKAELFSPDDVNQMYGSQAVITTNCGMTGHIPVICRGWGKGCIILEKDLFKKIPNGIELSVSGQQGIVVFLPL